MKISFLAVFIFALSLNIASAQDFSEGKHEIGFNFSGFFGQQAGGMYRLHQEKGAFRASLNFQGELLNRESHAKSRTREFNVKTSLGYQRFISENRWRFYYGADIVLDTRRFFQGSESSSWVGWTLTAGIKPIVGLTYHLHPKVSISFETALYAAYQYGESYSDSERNGRDYYSVPKILQFNIVPLNNLLLSYHF
ncbi:hypothetical protein RCC89_00425 [Cytophagaceae bacterium ABcell3]|nr:hypothetical protein RCC89_00425 [Cytophagaceae bacterium ABcell3]